MKEQHHTKDWRYEVSTTDKRVLDAISVAMEDYATQYEQGNVKARQHAAEGMAMLHGFTQTIWEKFARQQ